MSENKYDVTTLTTFEELQNELFKSTEMSDDTIKEFMSLSVSFVFGSSVYSKTDPADIDIAVLYTPDVNTLIHECVGDGSLLYRSIYYNEEVEGFMSYYARNKNRIINFLFFHDKESFYKYKKATKAMKVLHKMRVFGDITDDKDKRIRFFEFFKNNL
jgi:hypothetical protein